MAVVIGPGSVVTSLIPVLMIKEIREALKRKVAEGLPIIFVVNGNKDNETAYDDVISLFKLIEDSVGERVFGKDGFVLDIIVNDGHNIPEHLRRLLDLTDSKTTNIRRAERPRGQLGLAEGDARLLKSLYSEDLGIYEGALLTSIQREVRGRAPEESVGYDTVRLGKLIEQVVLERNREKLRKSEGYQEVLQIFEGNETAMGMAITHLLTERRLRSQLETLGILRTLYEGKHPLTEDLLRRHAPRVVITNLAHSIVQDIKQPEMTSSMAEQLNAYFQAGGYLVVATGVDYQKARSVLFAGQNRVLPEYRDRVYCITTSGGQLHRGDQAEPLEEEAPKIPEPVHALVQKVLSAYGISVEPPKACLEDRGSLLAGR